MNAVEIEQAITLLAEQPFSAGDFPFQFLEAFGNKPATIKKLKSGTSNSSDIEGGVLQRNNIHMAVCVEGTVTETLNSLKDSPITTKQKSKFILATDGVDLEAEDLNSGETVACPFQDFPNHFGFFLPLAGISTVKQIRNNPIDIQATSRLNRLYVELNKHNEDWATDEGRHEMNQFMARLIFCFFAEDTDLFGCSNLFTSAVDQMTDSRSDNTEYVIGEIFRAMDLPYEKREGENLPRWADQFPFVNGGLFSGSKRIPKFTRIARSYLLHAGNLNWEEINPDIFGSMIQAVADDDERGDLGMHYTSVPNILKVLNPLFLDSLREQLEEASDNKRKLLNLRKRIANIRVFDPACGSGNFLVISYIQMREIEAEVIKRREESNQRSWIRLDHFYGIEIKDFAAEVARLSLLIAEFQCDVRMIGQREAKALCLPLKKTGQIYQGNALLEDWLEICSPCNAYSEDEYNPARLTQSDEPEIYLCGNPPYLGSTWQSSQQKNDLKEIFNNRTKSWKSLDYVCGWFLKATDFLEKNDSSSAFVSTNSICQGQQVPILWPIIFDKGIGIHFAHISFKWTNLASNNAGVTVIIVGLKKNSTQLKAIYSEDKNEGVFVRDVPNISPYLVPSPSIIVTKQSKPLSELHQMFFGNKPVDGGNLLLSQNDFDELRLSKLERARFIRKIYGSAELIRGLTRYCLWIEDDNLGEAQKINAINSRIEATKTMRLASRDKGANELGNRPHQMREMNIGKKSTIALPCVSSENREYLPVALLDNKSTVTNLSFALFDAPLWNMALIASKIHLVWITTVCGQLETRIRYSNTIGWNTFPVPRLTEKNKADLTRCAEDILLAREAHFPATIADLYDPDNMPENLLHAHERNDETLERIYIGRRFKNDTERLEKLFDMYTKITAESSKAKCAKEKVS